MRAQDCVIVFQLLITIWPTQLCIHIVLPYWSFYNTTSASSRFIHMYAVSLAHFQVPECYNGSTVPTLAGPEATLPGVLVHVLSQDYLPALLKYALHPRLWAGIKVLLVVAVLPFPAAPLIGTGYMECVQLSSDSFVRKELYKLEE